MQGIITTPNGDVWALDNEHSQIVHLPKGDAAKGRILGGTVDGKPLDGTPQFKEPFHLAVDQRDRIWVTNTDDTVTRFPAHDPRKAEQIKVGLVPRGVAIDSLGNAWVANALGHPRIKEKLALAETMVKSKLEDIKGSKTDAEDRKAQMWIDLYDMAAKYPGGDVSMVDPDGTVVGTFDGGGSINAPWGRHRRQRQRMGRRCVWPHDHAPLRSPTRELPARRKDRRPDLTTWRLPRRSADHDGRRHRPRRQRLGGEQLGSTGRRLQEGAGLGVLHALRRQRHGRLLRLGEASEDTLDRTAAGAAADSLNLGASLLLDLVDGTSVDVFGDEVVVDRIYWRRSPP
jgi:hypothetical protein